jgi:hypothetical protein
MSQIPEPQPSTPDAPGGPEVVAPDHVAGPGEVAGGGPGAVLGAEGPGVDGSDESDDGISEIESPGKIIRIGAMVKQLLEEVRTTDLDEASRDQLRDIYENSIKELKSALSPDLGEELDQLSFDFSGEELPTGTELRLAKAQLVGWLEGLFHGIQATLMAQQMAARQQLEGVRGQLPEHAGPPSGPGYL